jgi:hypothetical protein
MTNGTFYFLLDCDNCEEEILHGRCITTLTAPDGNPVIPLSMTEQLEFECPKCGAESYTGDLDIYTEGGEPQTEEDEDEKDEEIEDAQTTITPNLTRFKQETQKAVNIAGHPQPATLNQEKP